MYSKPQKRIECIDALRGLCVILMVLHHFMYDLVEFLNAPEWLFTNPILDVLHYIFAGCFIFLSGLSSRFSRSNVKRGLKAAIIALIITLVTWYMDMIILFGVLHFLAFAMIFYGFTGKLWERLPHRAAPVIYIALIVGTALLTGRLSPVQADWLWPFGFVTRDFYSADYFPILPWIFVFLLGAWFGGIVRSGRLPGKFYTAKIKVLPPIGRRALIVYVLHQPVLYGITLLIGEILKK